MDNKKVIQFNPSDRMEAKAEVEEWEEDYDNVELGMGDLSNIADGFRMIREGLELISQATGVDLESV